MRNKETQPLQNLQNSEKTVFTANSESCRADRGQRFEKYLIIYKELLLDEGNPVEVIDEMSKKYEERFKNENPIAQKHETNQLSLTIEGRLTKRLNTDLEELYNIKRENGYGAADVGQDESTWKILFTQASKADKLQIVRDLKTEIGQTLVNHFDYYLSSWADVLAETGKTPEEIQNEINERKEKFDNASEFGKIGTAKTLREQIKTASEIRSSTETEATFLAYLEMYEKLTKEKGLDGDDYPEAEKLKQTFYEATTNKRGALCNQIQNLTIRSLTEKSINFPNA